VADPDAAPTCAALPVDEGDAAAGLLARAFRDNPLNRAVIESDDPGRRERVNRAGMRALVPSALRHACVLAARDARGLAGVLIAVEDRKTALDVADRGEAQAYAGDRAVLIGQVITTKTRTPDWRLLDADISYEPYAFAMPRGDPALQLAVNRAIAAVYRSGRIGDIYQRWFGRFGPPQPLLKAMYLLNQIPE